MTPAHATAVAQLASAAIKLAEEAKARQAAAPKATDPALVEKAAAALVETGFVEPTLKQAAVDKLSTPAGALELVHDLAKKAAEELARVTGQNPRLTAGEVAPTELNPTKQAAEHQAAELTDFVTRMATHRKST